MSAAVIAGLALAIAAGAILLLCAFAVFAGFNGRDTETPRQQDQAPTQPIADVIDIRAFCQRWED